MAKVCISFIVNSHLIVYIFQNPQLYHTYFRADVIRWLLSTPSRVYDESSSHYVSDRGVNKHDPPPSGHLILYPDVFGKVVQTVSHHQIPAARKMARAAALSCMHLPSDVTSLLGKQEAVETTWHPRSIALTWEWSRSREQSGRKNKKSPLNRGKFVYSNCIPSRHIRVFLSAKKRKCLNVK